VAEMQGKLEKAANAYSESIAILRKLVEGDPTNNKLQKELSESYRDLDNVKTMQGMAFNVKSSDDS
jgi:hypothetical protein